MIKDVEKSRDLELLKKNHNWKRRNGDAKRGRGTLFQLRRRHRQGLKPVRTCDLRVNVYSA